MDELFKVGVGGVADFAEPDVADADVQGVVVPHTSGDMLWSWCHVPGMTKVVVGLTLQRTATPLVPKQELRGRRRSQNANNHEHGHMLVRSGAFPYVPCGSSRKRCIGVLGLHTRLALGTWASLLS